VDGDAHALARTQPADIPLAPVGARRPVVTKVRVDIDQHVGLAPVLWLVVLGFVDLAQVDLVRCPRPQACLGNL
jgi:hypothetical protein